jgi:BMFP domain-containing protein YqiC
MLDAHAKSTGQLARSLAALEASVAQIVSAATTQVEVVQRDLKDLQIQQAEATRGRIDTIEARLVQTLAEHATATSREIEVTAAIQNAATLRALWWLRLCSFFGCSLLLLELYRIAINILGYPT